MHQIAKSSVESHDSGSERHAGVSSGQDNQNSPKLGERDQHFYNLPLSEAKYWGFTFDRPSNPSDPTPNEQQTALDLDLSEDENVRLFCKQCNNHLGGFRSEHELHSHRDREHSNGQTSTVKKYMCIQPTGPGHPTPLVPLSRCTLRDFEKFDKTMLDSGPPVPTTLDSLDSNKYKTALDSDLSQEEYGYENTRTPQKYPFLTPFYTQSEGMRHTLASLGWNRDTELLKLYTFIVPKGREPFFKLLEKWSPTYETPSRVHLDPPR